MKRHPVKNTLAATKFMLVETNPIYRKVNKTYHNTLEAAHTKFLQLREIKPASTFTLYNKNNIVATCLPGHEIVFVEPI